MDISSILNSYDRTRKVIDESHFELVVDAFRQWADNQEIDLVIEIIPAKREVWYKIGDESFVLSVFKGTPSFKQYKLNRLLLNEPSGGPVRIKFSSKGVNILHGAVFMENCCDDAEDENVDQVNP